MKMKLLYALTLTMVSALPAQRSLQDWIRIFPEANATMEAKADRLSYCFYFMEEEFDHMCLVLEATINPEWIDIVGFVDPKEAEEKVREKTEKYKGFMMGDRSQFLNLALSAHKLKFYIKTEKKREVCFEVPCSKLEFINMLGLIGEHEVFEIRRDPKLFIEPARFVIGGTTVVCIKNVGLKKITLERREGDSVPVSRLIASLWEPIMAKIKKLPKSELKKIASLLNEEDSSKDVKRLELGEKSVTPL